MAGAVHTHRTCVLLRLPYHACLICLSAYYLFSRFSLACKSCNGLLQVSADDERLHALLGWAAQRITPSTLSLEIKIGLPHKPPSSDPPPLLTDAKKAVEGTANLSNVRCISFEPEPDCPIGETWPGYGRFQTWVVKALPRLEALRLPSCGPRLASFVMRLQFLKHVEMEAHAFAWGVPDAARSLPRLETLCLHERGQGSDGINLLGCQHLKQLVVKGRNLRPVQHEPTCQLGVQMHGFTSKSISCWAESRRILETDEGKKVSAKKSHEPSSGGGVCGDITTVRTLHLAWPVRLESNGDKHPDSDALPDAESMLRWCVPVSGQPYGSLKALTITA